MKSLNGAAVVAAWGALAVGGVAVAQDVVCWGRQGIGFCSPNSVPVDVRWVFGAACRTEMLSADGSVFHEGCHPGPPNGPAPVVAMAMDNSTLVLTDNGTLLAWGLDNAGQVSQIPDDLSGIRSVACGAYSNGAVFIDSTVLIWGQGHLVAVPPDLQSVQSLHIGHDAAFALLSDGTVRGWGLNVYGALDIPPDLPPVRAMDVGDWHVIALLEDGTVRCWGDNRRGQCSVPLGLSGVLAVQAAGGWSDSGHCAVILNDGTVVAWGSNQYGETSVPPGLTARYLSSGHRHLVAITGDPDCNGDGMYDTAQIADGTLLDNNRNGIPDTCECFADINDDGTVNGADISVLLGYWGQSGKNVVGDITGDGIVNGADLAQLLGSWGPCQ